jgi:hypothetical protein
LRKVTIALTGGLGNQLFQLAAALSFAQGGTVEIMTKPGRPRLNSDGDPELLSFVLPPNVTIVSSGYFGKFLSKVIGFNLRSGYSPKLFELTLRPLIRVLSSFSIFLLTGKLRKVVVGQDLGYSENLRLGKRMFLIGYFQSYKYISSLKHEQFVKYLKYPNSRINEYVNFAELEQPLIVHVRLGDYRLEESFGILDEEYYQANCKKLWETNNYLKIWLFSDEPEEAVKMIPQELTRHVRIIDSNGLSSAETLKMMTLGKGYLTANSTFSWWGAYLSDTKGRTVVVPDPWFKTTKSPADLIPNDWQLASRSISVQ